jgi:hypothetical protein
MEGKKMCEGVRAWSGRAWAGSGQREKGCGEERKRRRSGPGRERRKWAAGVEMKRERRRAQRG